MPDAHDELNALDVFAAAGDHLVRARHELANAYSEGSAEGATAAAAVATANASIACALLGFSAATLDRSEVWALIRPTAMPAAPEFPRSL